MSEVSIIDLDLAKNAFQADGMRLDGGVEFWTKLVSLESYSVFALQQRCIVAMEACASSHYWGCVIGLSARTARMALHF